MEFKLFKKIFKKENKKQEKANNYLNDENMKLWEQEEQIFSGLLGDIAEKHHG
jgi:hypothetical protein